MWSSGVAFYPPSKRFWRIGKKWYDFEPFFPLHPGGAEILQLARDRFEDATYAFEAHHHNYPRARALIAKYEVPAPKDLPLRSAGMPGADTSPELLGDDAFYSKVRKRLTQHLRAIRCPGGGPTQTCRMLFWCNFAAFCISWVAMFVSGWAAAAVLFGLVASLLGAFGHNWVHQPNYRSWAYLSLDVIGFSSTGWFREHVLQHHMYTNTPWDNHFHGTDPFLVTDPTTPRHWIQSYVMPYINPVILTFGLYANFLAHAADMLKGREEWRLWKAILPLNIAAMVCRWGLLRGWMLTHTWISVLGLWYFTMALMNHNAERCMDVDARNAARDWGEAQLVTCADWSIGLSFERAWRYLWLNFHTVHHLFPRLDFSHHPAAQQIIMEVCAEFNIHYSAADSPLMIYKQMIRSFATPRALYKTVMVYGGM
eukprot:CAMPEP_0119307142 /NCGR_PEP_ID=MMETSP1333-20130426/7715_1 /TAXON_ID=418940 /ORGANISM="Scyphosphaera apsteinii, Strain RCC1455" /LENGTH=424 /DNA_ID=CAMNT_0007310615 /DNA_START=139 /DNA_END=1413 /DNA_ORIENTATION=+